MGACAVDREEQPRMAWHYAVLLYDIGNLKGAGR